MKSYTKVGKELLTAVEDMRKYYFYLYRDEFSLENDQMPPSTISI